MPRSARCTVPYSIKSLATFFTKETGTANEYPAKAPDGEAMAVFIPTSSPFKFTSAPPLFPGRYWALSLPGNKLPLFCRPKPGQFHGGRE